MRQLRSCGGPVGVLWSVSQLGWANKTTASLLFRISKRSVYTIFRAHLPITGPHGLRNETQDSAYYGSDPAGQSAVA